MTAEPLDIAGVIARDERVRILKDVAGVVIGSSAPVNFTISVMSAVSDSQRDVAALLNELIFLRSEREALIDTLAKDTGRSPEAIRRSMEDVRHKVSNSL